MSTIVWVSLVVSAVLVLGGLAVASLKGLGAWRALRRFRNGTEKALLDVTDRLAKVEERMAGASGKAAELEQARARLQVSLRMAAMLTSAAAETWTLADRARGFMPNK